MSGVSMGGGHFSLSDTLHLSRRVAFGETSALWHDLGLAMTNFWRI
jgi:hypothetical protein